MGLHFKQPVQIFVGLGFPKDVESVLEAWHVLLEVPSSMRRDAHAAALDACVEALTCNGQAGAARDAFERFAKANGILAADERGCHQRMIGRHQVGGCPSDCPNLQRCRG